MEVSCMCNEALNAKINTSGLPIAQAPVVLHDLHGALVIMPLHENRVCEH